MSVEHDELMHDIACERRQERYEANMPEAVERLKLKLLTEGIDLLIDSYLNDVPEALEDDWQDWVAALRDGDAQALGSIELAAFERQADAFIKGPWGRDMLERILEDMEDCRYDD